MELSQDESEFERATSPLLTYDQSDTLQRRRVNTLIRDIEKLSNKKTYYDRV